jgi:MoaA/NifB/PqqE/SkfB family radical SAM enzyme
MLAELAAFNAGFAVVKQFVANGRDLSDAMGAIGKMVSAKEDLKARGEKKKKSVLSLLGSKTENDFEEFMALEKIKQVEAELATMMKLYGRPGLYDDWIRFQAEARKKRREEALAEKKRKEQMWEYAAYIAAGLLFIAGVVGLFMWVKFLVESNP